MEGAFGPRVGRCRYAPEEDIAVRNAPMKGESQEAEMATRDRNSVAASKASNDKWQGVRQGSYPKAPDGGAETWAKDTEQLVAG